MVVDDKGRGPPAKLFHINPDTGFERVRVVPDEVTVSDFEEANDEDPF